MHFRGWLPMNFQKGFGSDIHVRIQGNSGNFQGSFQISPSYGPDGNRPSSGFPAMKVSLPGRFPAGYPVGSKEGSASIVYTRDIPGSSREFSDYLFCSENRLGRLWSGPVVLRVLVLVFGDKRPALVGNPPFRYLRTCMLTRQQ